MIGPQDLRAPQRGRPAGARLRPQRRRSPPHGREYLVVLLSAAVLYLASVAPGPLWQDSGLAQVRVLRRDLYGGLGLALSHPLYYVLAIALQVLPLGGSAFRTNLVSPLFGALTVANAFLLLRWVTGRRTPAVVGALSLAVAHTFWQHCALAEVYTVSTALLTTELLCLWRYARRRRGRWLVLLFLANGLGVSNHNLALLSLACYAVMVLSLVVGRRVRRATLVAAAGAWLAGAALYLGLIAGRVAAGAGLGATLQSALFGSNYAARVLSLGLRAHLLLTSLLVLGLNFPTPAALLALPGLRALRRGRPRLFVRVFAGLLAVHLAWAVRYDVPDQYTFFIPAIVLLGLLIGMGAGRFLRRGAPVWGVLLIGAGLLPALLYVPLPQIARRAGVPLPLTRSIPYREPYGYFLRPWKTGYRGPQRFAAELRATLPAGAYLIADGTTVRPIHYLALTGRWRSDVGFWPPLGGTAPGQGPAQEALRSRLGAGLVFVVSPRRGYCPSWLLEGYAFRKLGVVYRVAAAGSRPAGARQPGAVPAPPGRERFCGPNPGRGETSRTYGR